MKQENSEIGKKIIYRRTGPMLSYMILSGFEIKTPYKGAK